MKLFKKHFSNLFGNPKTQNFMIPLLAVILGLLTGSVLILFLGKNPLVAYTNIMQGAGILPKASYAGGKGLLTDFLSLLDMLSPMIFAALAVAVAFKAGVFNIGVAGQMLCAGFVTTVLIGYSDLPSIISKPLVILIGAACGGIIGGFIGWLKYRFNINEVVASIMINYIIQFIVSFFISTRYLNNVSRQSNEVTRAARLTLKNQAVLGYKADIPLAIILGIIIAIVLKILLDKTRVGYELKAVGLSPKAAQYAGLSIRNNVLKAMFISGALAGLAGVSYYIGYFGSIQPKVLPAIGFDAIVVSLLGNNNPIGILVSSFFITIISKGSNYMNSKTGIETEITAVITAIILCFCACSFYLKEKIALWKAESDDKGDM